MASFTAFFLFSGLVILLAAFFASDCDLALNYLPFDNAKEQAFENKIVWVTGASSGIGAGLAKDFVVGGATVIISARRVPALEQVARDCALVGKEPIIVPLDVTDYEQQQIAYDGIIKQFGRIDILILNPGRTQRALALETSLEDTQTLMDLNFMSYVSLSKIALPAMVEQKGGGSVVVMSSVSGKLGTPISSTYSATKWALHGYFDALRTEYSYKGLHVLLVCPGPVVSEISKHSIKGVEAEKTGQKYETSAEVRMTTERSTDLMVKAVKYKFDEVWISKQPFLAITYLNVYCPWLSRQLFKNLIGPARIKAHEEDGNVFDIKELFKAFLKSN